MPYRPYGPFKDVHPTATGRRPLGSLKGQDLPPEAMLSGAKHNESRWVRCYQCGFPVDTERDLTHGEEPAISYPTVTITDGGGTSYTAQDRRVLSGCPLCGADQSAIGPGR